MIKVNMKRSTILFSLTLLLSCLCVKAEELKLWYSRPAQNWTEALPIGNSHLGAMIYGGTDVKSYNSTKKPSGLADPIIITA